MARASQASGRTPRAPHAKQRAAFTELLLKNPNYFGNLPDSGLEPVLVLEANTSYEQLTCVGYSPAVRRHRLLPAREADVIGSPPTSQPPPLRAARTCSRNARCRRSSSPSSGWKEIASRVP